jgi:hypothetical protein
MALPDCDHCGKDLEDGLNRLCLKHAREVGEYLYEALGLALCTLDGYSSEGGKLQTLMTIRTALAMAEGREPRNE